MAVAHDASKDSSWLARVLTTDFCPWANRFVYWLKEPVGWFVLAACVSAIVGLYVSPIGWTIGASLIGLIVVGMVWPWVAVRTVVISLSPSLDRVHEGDECGLTLSVRNRLPIPLWGMAVEGFLDRQQDSPDVTELPTVALAYVRALSVCRYRFDIRPSLRGHYPCSKTSIACSFPFGIWTARRPIEKVRPITVWPKVYPVGDDDNPAGRRRVSAGDGNGRGGHGDFIGIREYRFGDGSKHVDWVSTARLDRLMVTERGAPQCPAWEVILDDGPGTRDVVADRVRVAASVLAKLHGDGKPIRLRIGNWIIGVHRGYEGFVRMMDALAEIPIEGRADSRLTTPGAMDASITIASSADGNVHVCVINPEVNHRVGESHQHRMVDRHRGLAQQIYQLWELKRADERVA